LIVQAGYLCGSYYEACFICSLGLLILNEVVH
jgi:hypothetical protein